jgi:MFS family permease
MVLVTREPVVLAKAPAAIGPGAAWALVGLMWVAYFLNYTDRQVVSSIFPVLKSELEFTDAQLGLTLSLFLWVYALCSPIAGMLGDRFPRRTLIVGSLVLWSAITALTGASGSAVALLVCRGLMGFAESVFFPAAVTLTAHAHSPSSRSRAVALFTTAQLGGTVMGGWYGGTMAEHQHWRWAFGSLGLAGIFYALPYAWFLRRIGEPAKTATPGWSVGGLSRISTYGVLCVVFPSFTFVVWLLNTWLPNFFHEKFALSLGEAGLAATAWLQGGTLAGLLVGGALADRLFRRFRAARVGLIVAGLLLIAPGLHLVGAMASLRGAQIAAAGVGVGCGLAMANFFPSCFDVVPRGLHNSAVGVLNLLGGLVGGGASLLGGLLKKSVGISGLLSAAALLCVAMAAVLAVGTRRGFERDFEHAREVVP